MSSICINIVIRYTTSSTPNMPGGNWISRSSTGSFPGINRGDNIHAAAMHGNKTQARVSPAGTSSEQHARIFK